MQKDVVAIKQYDKDIFIFTKQHNNMQQQNESKDKEKKRKIKEII